MRSTLESSLSMLTFWAIFEIRSDLVVWKSLQQAASNAANFWAIWSVFRVKWDARSRLSLIGWG